MTHHFKLLFVSVASCAVLAACGGGGGGGSAPTPVVVTPPTSSGPVFQAGTFAPSSSYVAQCQTVRTGIDPLTDARYADRAGSTLLEKFWIRSWSNETYLWNDEITDVDPNSIASKIDYFDVMKSFELTESGSGREKDDFHFSEDTESFVARRNSTATSGYGLRLTSVGPRDANGASIPPRDFRILYTEPNSPASAVQNGSVNFPRGTRILEVDGADLVNGNDSDTLNAGLFPALAGETHTFKVEDVDGTERTFTITSADVAQAPVNRTEVIDTTSGKVGYMLFNTFSPFESEAALNDAFTQLETEQIDDLVLDLRYNGGGLVVVAAQLGYMIAGSDRTAGKTASLLQYNEDAGNTNPTTGEVVRPIPFVDEGVGFSVSSGTPLATVDLPRVYILTTGGTCSASELVINALRGIDYDVVMIGDTTCGKPYGFLKELGDPDEALLATALYYRENDSCPTTATAKSYARTEKSTFDSVDNGYGITAIGDPFETTVDSYLDATPPPSEAP